MSKNLKTRPCLPDVHICDHWLVVSSEQRALGLAASVEETARLGTDCGSGHGRPDQKIGTGKGMLLLPPALERSFCGREDNNSMAAAAVRK